MARKFRGLKKPKANKPSGFNPATDTIVIKGDGSKSKNA